MTTSNLLDAIVYGTDDPAPANLMLLVNARPEDRQRKRHAATAQTQSSQRCPNGMGGVRNTSTYLSRRADARDANTCPAARPPSDIVISQIYGGGGNSGATYHNDYVELFNRGAGTVDLDAAGRCSTFATAASNGCRLAACSRSAAALAPASTT